MKYHLILLLLIFNTGLYAQIALKTDLQTGKMGFVDASGNTVVPMEYDFLPFEYAPQMVARKGDKRGVIDGQGQTLAPFEYHTIQLEKYGFVLVSKDKSKQPVLGLLDSVGNVVLPLLYEYIAVLDSHLLAARLFNNNEVIVFDKKGNLLFKTEGNEAMPGFGDSTVLIQKPNRSTYWVNLHGTILTPAKYANIHWSDGDYFIAYQHNRYGVLNDLGDTVLPFRYAGLQPLNKGHFSVSDSAYRNFSVDGRGKILAEGDCNRLGDQEGDAYFNSGAAYTNKLYDATGKLLLENCTVDRVWSAPYCENLPENHSGRYCAITFKDTELRAFYRADGVQILPPLFKTIHYATDRHPLIGFSKNEKTGSHGSNLYDFNGKALLEQPYANLNFTDDPYIFTGRLTHGTPWGFIDLRAPEKTEFLYQNLQRQPDGSYRATLKGEPVQLPLPGRALPPQTTTDTELIEPPEDFLGFEEPNNGDMVFETHSVEKPPSFPGGETALTKYLEKNLNYPPVAKQNGIQGTVVLGFIVGKDGSISDISVLRDIGGGCGQEAARLVSFMPNWQPGMKGGQNVRVRHTLPVRFKM